VGRTILIPVKNIKISPPIIKPIKLIA